MRFFFMYHHVPFIYVNQNYLLISLDVSSPAEFSFSLQQNYKCSAYHVSSGTTSRLKILLPNRDIEIGFKFYIPCINQPFHTIYDTPDDEPVRPETCRI